MVITLIMLRLCVFPSNIGQRGSTKHHVVDGRLFGTAGARAEVDRKEWEEQYKLLPLMRFASYYLVRVLCVFIVIKVQHWVVRAWAGVCCPEGSFWNSRVKITVPEMTT